MRKFVILVVLIVIGAVAYFNFYIHGTVNSSGRTVYLMVLPGEGLGKILARADSLRLNLSPLMAKTYIKLYSSDRKIVPGRYTVKQGSKRIALLRRLRSGDIDYVWITIPEGLTVNRTLEMLAQKSGRQPEEFIRLIHNRDFLSSLPFSPDDLEGFLYPETYRAPYYAEPEYLVRTLVESLNSYLDSNKTARMREIGFSIKELLTFASLIEAETADRREMPVISSVYHNRLRKNMLLQCDPTVIYALGGLDRQLLIKDLKYDSPYNTYRYKGLPPGPINSPGKDALLAALYPDSTDYLFFVADTNGKHIFSVTNAQHDRARSEIKRKRSQKSN